MGVHEFGGQLLRHLLAKVLRDAKPNVSGQRDVDLRQLYDVHLFEVRIQRGNVTSVNLHILKTKKKNDTIRRGGRQCGVVIFLNLYIPKSDDKSLWSRNDSWQLANGAKDRKNRSIRTIEAF